MVAFPEDFDHGGNSGESVPRLHAVASAVPLSQVPLVIDIVQSRGWTVMHILFHPGVVAKSSPVLQAGKQAVEPCYCLVCRADTEEIAQAGLFLKG